MGKILFRLSFVLGISALSVLTAGGQTAVCKKTAAAAFRPLPRIEYQCPQGIGDSDEALLEDPGRRKSLGLIADALGKLVFPDWWSVPAADLNACAPTEKNADGDEAKKTELLGNSELRIVKFPDPCYRPHENGGALFLLYRKGGKVIASPLADGLFSTRDPDISAAFAVQGGEKIIEIGFSDSAFNQPVLIRRYFAIDPKTGRAGPKNLFAGDKKPTNEIVSMAGLGDTGGAKPLQVFKNGRLASSFYVLDDKSGSGRLVRRTLRWNGKIYR
ncbi:MAG: hypothetical protein JSS81_19525 [Acidobacteria bacterium]|nr:hypothetical protein [Acidobacteriota bacterium]